MMDHLEFGVHAAIGRGAFGRTYRATRSDGVQVALKVLSADAVEELDLDHLERTLRALSHVSHHAIPGEQALVVYRGDRVLTHAYVEGQDVGSLVAMCAMPPRVAVAVVAEAAGALDAVANTVGPDGHLLGVQHGDLRPGCLLLREDGDLAVVGFGLCRIREGHRDRTLTRFAESLGYMAPERLDGRTSPTADVYSLALCLFTMITGEIPARGSAHPKRHEARSRDTVGLLEEVLAPGHLEVARLVERALAYAPEDRPTMDAFARSCARLAEELEGPRVSEWAGEWVALARRVAAEVPFEDHGGPLSVTEIDRGAHAGPHTLSPGPPHPRLSPGAGVPAVRSVRGLVLVAAVVGVMAISFGLAWLL